MREPIIHQDETEDAPKPEPTASGAGHRGPPTRIGAMFGDDKSGDWRGLPIEELSLSKRAYNVLHRSGLVTIGQVTEKSEEELLALRNFGQKCCDELRDKLAEMGILRAPSPRPGEPL